jgi:hypothetical protein
MKGLKLPGGVTILQPEAIVAIAPHGTKTALYTTGGTILVDDSPDLVADALKVKVTEVEAEPAQ